MIINKEKTIASIKKWICDYAEINNIELLIIPAADLSTSEKLLDNICRSQTKFRIDYVIDDGEIDRGVPSIIISSLNKSEYNLIRKYHKYDCGKGSADIFPLIDLYESDIANLANIAFNSFEHYFVGITYNDLEWAQEENKKYGIVENDELPQHTLNWFKYTLPQKEIITKLHQREKQTRHKIIAGRPMLKF